jgi:hypothetical protein
MVSVLPIVVLTALLTRLLIIDPRFRKVDCRASCHCSAAGK